MAGFLYSAVTFQDENELYKQRENISIHLIDRRRIYTNQQTIHIK